MLYLVGSIKIEFAQKPGTSCIHGKSRIIIRIKILSNIKISAITRRHNYIVFLWSKWDPEGILRYFGKN